MKKVEVIFDKEANEEYETLKNLVSKNKKSRKKPTYEQLLNSVNSVINNLKLNPYCGDLIPRKYISKSITKRYGTNKIFRIELVGYWRILYTTIGDEVKIIAFILEFMDHDKYNKIFGYNKR